MHVIESEPQGIADQVGEKKDQNVHIIQPEPQGLVDEGERILGSNDRRIWGLIRR